MKKSWYRTGQGVGLSSRVKSVTIRGMLSGFVLPLPHRQTNCQPRSQKDDLGESRPVNDPEGKTKKRCSTAIRRKEERSRRDRIRKKNPPQ